MRRLTTIGAFIMILSFAALFCNRPLRAAENLPQPARDLAPPQDGEQTRTAVFAAGCFWCVEALFERLEGVTNVVSGYAGGTEQTAQYKRVSEGETDHAEVVQVTYDPGKITYGELLRVFFVIHDPTTKDRQGPDWGRQYRSAIFYANDEQKQVAESYIRQLTDAKTFDAPIVTTLEPLDGFYPAETYHQDFVTHNPNHPYIRQWLPDKVEKLEKNFGDELKEQNQGQ